MSPTADAPSTALEEAVLTGAPPVFDPYTGADLRGGPEARRGVVEEFRAAELGLEAPRFCQLCGRRMIVQVAPTGWEATCSRHGPLTSDLGAYR